MATNKDTLFDKTLNGSFWNAGVTFERTNPVPLEKYSIFRTLEAAQNYAKTNAVSYLGQIITVIGGEQEYSAWTFSDGGTHTVAWNGTKWTIDGTPCTDSKQLPESLSITTGSLTATRTITKPYAVANYKIVDTNGTLEQIDAAITPSDLPIASKTQLGAVKIGEGLDITAEGELSAQKLTVDQVIDSTTKGSANPVSTSAVYEFTKSVSADVKAEAGKLDEALENKLSTYVQTTFIPLSAANSPDGSDKLTKVSEVKTMLSALDVATQTLAAYKTIKTIGEEDGRISVTTQDIAISQDQVTDLTSDLDAIRSDVEYLGGISADHDGHIEDLEADVADLKAISGDLSNALTAEVKAREDNDDFLSGQIKQLTSDLSDYALSADVTSIRNELTAADALKLDKTDFAQISNDTGLSAASPTNKVVTKADIKDLEGAMHFRGVTEDENLVDDYIGKPNDVAYYNDHDPVAGDVVLRKDNAKEFIFSGTYGDGGDGRWREIGDEDLYVKKTDLELSVSNLETSIENALTAAKDYTNTVSAALSDDYVDKISAEAALRKADDDFLSGAIKQLTSDLSDYALSADVTAISGSLYARDQFLSGKIDDEVARAAAAEGVISTAVDSKIYIDGLSAQSLSARHENVADYYEKVIEGSVLSNELYILSAEYINAYGEQIKNVADPTDPEDAVNKKYADNEHAVVEGHITTAVESLSSELYGKINSLSASNIWDIDQINCGNAS